MQESGKARDFAAQPKETKPLPLFRPEALAAQQQKFYGQIVLIRPFSLVFLGWLGVAIAVATLVFLVLGSYTEKARVPGILLIDIDSPAPSGSPLTADFYVPSRWITMLHAGEPIAF